MNQEYAHRDFKKRRQKRDRAPRPEPVLPTEMTAAGYAMEAELEHRRVVARKEALRKSRLKKHQMFAVTLQGGSIKP
jgi:hypothetical protein